MKRLISAALVLLALAYASCSSTPMQPTRVIRAVPGGPYSADSERDVTFSAVGSTAAVNASLVRFRWNCGQATAHRVNCLQDSLTPIFRYGKTGQIAAGPLTFTVTLTVEDSLGNSNTATTTVTVRQVY